MPEFGQPDSPVLFPSWGTPGPKISRHPHPGTPRSDGLLAWPSDSLYRNIATRQYGRLYWQEDEPDVNQPYENWSNVWWDWESLGPSQATAVVGTTVDGFLALLRLKYYGSLPLLGVPGTEFYCEFFRDDVSIGIKTVEFDDQTHPFQFDTAIGEGGGYETLRTPAEPLPLSGGVYVKLTANPSPECWRWFDAGWVTPCDFELNPAGMASVAVRFSGFGWGANNFAGGGKKTQLQLDFARFVNQKHILAPVWTRQVGFFPCLVQFQSEFWHDENAFIIAPNVGLWYGFSAQVMFDFDRIRMWWHIRVFEGSVRLPFWEKITSLAISMGLFGFGAIHGQMGRATWGVSPAPYASRNISDLDASGPTFITAVVATFLNPLDPPDYELLTVEPSERGTEQPQGAPLDMFRQQLMCLCPSDGTTPSVVSPTKLPLGVADYDIGGWRQGGVDDGLIVPAGVNWIEAIGNTHTGNSASSAQAYFWIDDVAPLRLGVQKEKGNFSGYDPKCNVTLPPTPVIPGQKVSLLMDQAGASLKNSTNDNWLFVRAIQPGAEVVSRTVVDHDEAMPAAGASFWFYRVPPMLDGWEITDIAASLGQSKSPTTDLLVHLSWLREVGRVVADITNDPIQIDADEWTDETSSAPWSLFAGSRFAQSGDILVASLIQTAANAEGLIVNVRLQEPLQ